MVTKPAYLPWRVFFCPALIGWNPYGPISSRYLLVRASDTAIATEHAAFGWFTDHLATRALKLVAGGWRRDGGDPLKTAYGAGQNAAHFKLVIG